MLFLTMVPISSSGLLMSFLSVMNGDVVEFLYAKRFAVSMIGIDVMSLI